MPRPKGSKNKSKDKPAKPRKAEKKAPIQAAEVGKAGQSRRVITENDLKKLMRSCASLKGEADSITGTLREKIAYSVEHHYLDKSVFALIRRLDKMEPEKLLIFLENFDHYLDISGLNARADSVGKLPLDAKAETEEEGGETEADGPPTTIKPAEVSRPQGVQTSQAPGGTVHMLPDRRAAAPNT